MKLTLKILLLLFSVNSFATDSCHRLFDAGNEAFFSPLETQSKEGKPKYFTVKGYRHMKDGELDKYLKGIKNLTQFADNVAEVNSFIPSRETVPSEGFFIANEIIPLIESHLEDHSVAHRIETKNYESIDGKEIRRTVIIIEPIKEGTVLNKIAFWLSKQHQLFVVDPINLFYGNRRFMQSKGSLYDLDSYTQAYRMSFFLLLHFNRKDLRNDTELEVELDEIVENFPPTPKEIEEKQEELDAHMGPNPNAAAKINALIEAARKKKAEEAKKNGSH